MAETCSLTSVSSKLDKGVGKSSFLADPRMGSLSQLQVTWVLSEEIAGFLADFFFFFF